MQSMFDVYDVLTFGTTLLLANWKARLATPPRSKKMQASVLVRKLAQPFILRW
jgi:hypothetical protein